MKKLILYLLPLLLLYSCSNFKTVSVKSTTSLTPDIVRLDVTLDDFDYLGKSEISVASRRYFGIISRVDSINNSEYNRHNKKIVKLRGLTDIKLRGPIKKAAFKVLEEYPEANFYIAGNYSKKYQQMFFGKWIWRKMDIYAYKISE